MSYTRKAVATFLRDLKISKGLELHIDLAQELEVYLETWLDEQIDAAREVFEEVAREEKDSAVDVVCQSHNEEISDLEEKREEAVAEIKAAVLKAIS